MATLLLWISWRAEPDPTLWGHLRERARARSVFPGVELSGPGFRLYAAPSRAAEPATMLETSAEDGSREILLLDRAIGADDKANRESDDWPDPRLTDGTPTAAARWNPNSRSLRLYRDLMGQRFLAYARIKGGVLVASGEDVLRAHPEISGDLDSLYLATYFAALPAGPEETVYRDIRCLGAGEVLTFDAQGGSRSTTSTLQPDWSWQGMTDEAVIERFRELFQRSVEAACRGARRVGISLSAGMDSSSIAAVASRIPELQASGIVATTHALPDFPEIDESSMVAALTQELGIEHLPFPVDHLHPFSDPALRPVCPDTPQQWPYREWYESGCQRFREAGVDVWLSGALGDHLYAGSVEWVMDALRYRRFGLLARQLASELGRKGWRELLGDTALRRPFSRMLGRVSHISNRVAWLDPALRTVVTERLHAEVERYRAFPRPQHCTMLLNTNVYSDAHREQWHAARHGMEYRLPVCDLSLSRYCLSLPADFSYRDGQHKWVLRQAMRGLLPDNLRFRRKSSCLTPVYQRAIQQQQQTLDDLCRQTDQLPAQYYARLKSLGVERDLVDAVQWLQASLASWSKLT